MVGVAVDKSLLHSSHGASDESPGFLVLTKHPWGCSDCLGYVSRTWCQNSECGIKERCIR